MIIKIKSIKPIDNYILHVEFDDNRCVLYDMNEDINSLPGYDSLKNIPNLWNQVQLDESRTFIFWSDMIDLPSNILYEYGKECPT